MIRLRRGVVQGVSEERPGAVELTVRFDDEPEPARAIAYPSLCGDVRPGDRVLLNITAVALGLGTGGAHVVVAVEGRDPSGLPEDDARIMKLRYTPLQTSVRAVEEPGGQHREAYERAEAEGLQGTPVVWLPLHSLLAPAAAGAAAAGAERVVYVMTDGAALPAGFSRLAARLRSDGLIGSVVTSGQAFGGDLESVTVFGGLLAARDVADADVILVGDGPGNTGTNTTWGASDVASATALDAAAILEGRPIAALRISFADDRERHRGVSHHSRTALGRVAQTAVHVAVPALDEGPERTAVWDALRDPAIADRHQLVEVAGEPALDLLASHGIAPESMGRSVDQDRVFWLAGGAAGILAARMAAANRRWA